MNNLRDLTGLRDDALRLEMEEHFFASLVMKDSTPPQFLSIFTFYQRDFKHKLHASRIMFRPQTFGFWRPQLISAKHLSTVSSNVPGTKAGRLAKYAFHLFIFKNFFLNQLDVLSPYHTTWTCINQALF